MPGFREMVEGKGQRWAKTSKILPGNVSEPETLSKILLKLKAKPGVTIVMDAGFATEENIIWLKENNYEYIVVSRKRNPMPDNIDPKNGSRINNTCLNPYLTYPYQLFDISPFGEPWKQT